MTKERNLRMIVAASSNGILGKNNSIPWHYPEDMKHFKEMTEGHVVIMGRNTFESLPNSFKPLPKRHNIVITSNKDDRYKDSVEFCASIEEALASEHIKGIVYFIGGTLIYQEALSYVDEIYVTVVPDYITAMAGDKLALMPWINPSVFKVESSKSISDKLTVFKYVRI